MSNRIQPDTKDRKPLLSATLIARDEAHNIKRALDSIWPWCDEVVVVDTGSTDGTVAALRAYAQKRKDLRKLKIGRFKWCDDFSAARQAADDLATGQWVVWADFDDVVVGMKELREYVARASDDVVAFFTKYRYASDPDGNAISELWRERVVRHNGTRWAGRLHEHKIFQGGQVVKVDPNIAEWVHHRDHAQRTNERNLRVLGRWDRDEPNNPRIIQSIAMEHMGAQQPAEASDMFARYLLLPGEAPDRRAQAYRHMAIMLMIQGRVQEARESALRSIQDLWLWADTHLTLAETAQSLGRPQEGLHHAETALRLGQPDTLLIINPLQYTVHPRALMAVCLAQMGRTEEAIRVAEEALRIAPSYQLLTEHLPAWRGAQKRQHAVGAFMACADVLVEAGELLKAQALLSSVPWYVQDDQRLVARRGETYHEIARRQGEGGVLEDPAADAFAKRHVEAA